MPRYIDADILIDLATHEGAYGYVDVHDILNIPTADVAEVVRCKNCEYGEQDEDGRWYCRSFGCQIGDADGNGFCADGERRRK